MCAIAIENLERKYKMRLALILSLTMLLLGCDGSSPRRVRMDASDCLNLANETYAEALAEAIADPTVWGFSGNTSAQDYAVMRRNFMLQICG